MRRLADQNWCPPHGLLHLLAVSYCFRFVFSFRVSCIFSKMIHEFRGSLAIVILSNLVWDNFLSSILGSRIIFNHSTVLVWFTLIQVRWALCDHYHLHTPHIHPHQCWRREPIAASDSSSKHKSTTIDFINPTDSVTAKTASVSHSANVFWFVH